MLNSEIVETKMLTSDDRREMFNLFQMYYENVSSKQFNSDLERKDCVIMIKKDKLLCGFSTQVLIETLILNRKVKVLFSGDTIIDKHHRNSMVLPLAWGRFMLSILNSQPLCPLYWLLTSKGYKTYRYLSVFYDDYFPKPARELTKFEEQILRAMDLKLFNGRLDKKDFILRAEKFDQRLRPGVADIVDAKRSKPEIKYFEDLNPGHIGGDELVCLAPFRESNLKPFILRRLTA